LLLEVFAAHPDVVLHVVGPVDAEPDFMRIYARELTQLQNIRFHGFLSAHDDRFRHVVEQCACFVSPSCSEGMSTAAATCLQVGLYPVISRHTGIALPDGLGVYLETCALEEVERAVLQVRQMDARRLAAEIQTLQSWALREFSQANFHARMAAYLTEALRPCAC
jgi:glycosyltransferase involved in cell wall biosynthesis